MADQYSSFAALASDGFDGIDYCIRAKDRGNPITLIACHGCFIEQGAPQIADPGFDQRLRDFIVIRVSSAFRRQRTTNPASKVLSAARPMPPAPSPSRGHICSGCRCLPPLPDGSITGPDGSITGPDGSITGDVDIAGVSAKATAITPVPGGVGPMSVTMLLENTILSSERAARPTA